MASAAALLAAEAQARGRRRPRGPLPSTEVPRTLERQYLRELLELLRKARDLVRERLLPEIGQVLRQANPDVVDAALVVDDWVEILSRQIDGIRIEYGRRVQPEEFVDVARRAGWRTVDLNRMRTAQQLRVLLGLDVLRDPPLEETVRSFTRENVGLIRTIPERYFQEIESAVIRNARAGVRASALAAELEERFDVAESRAALVARDQTNKLSGEVTRIRHKALGVTSYIWRTSRDDRVRPGHALLEGQICEWAEAPVVDPASGRRAHPGGDIQCRCTAEPVIPGINDEPAKPLPRRASVAPGGDVRSTKGSGGNVVLEDGVSLGDAEDAIRGKRLEHIGVFAGDGTLLHTDVGTSNSVPVPRRIMELMRRRRDVTITHNHPRGLPLSPPDIAIAITGNAIEMRATRPQGGAWTVRRPEGGWRTRLKWAKLVDELDKAYSSGVAAADAKLIEEVRRGAGKITPQQFQRLQARLIAREIPAAYNAWAESRGYGWRVELDHRHRRRRGPAGPSGR